MLRRHWPVIVLIVALVCAGGPVALYYHRKAALEEELVESIRADDEARVLKALRSWPCPWPMEWSGFSGADRPMKWAIQRDQVDVLRILLDRGEAPDIPFSVQVFRWGMDGWTRRTPVEHAAYWGSSRCLELLVKRGAGVRGDTLANAVEQGHLELAEWLVSQGADVHAKDAQGRSLLHRAAKGNIPAAIRFALERGFEVDESDREGNTPLHAAAYGVLEDGFFAVSYFHHNADRTHETFALLLDHGAHVNARNDGGMTPLHVLAWQAFTGQSADGVNSAKAYCDFVGHVIERGADVNAVDNRGNTPLHLAARRGVPDLVELLLKRGADKSLKNNDGKTALDLTETPPGTGWDPTKSRVRQLLGEGAVIIKD